jgi:hypothetical protein
MRDELKAILTVTATGGHPHDTKHTEPGDLCTFPDDTMTPRRKNEVSEKARQKAHAKNDADTEGE